jgi:hypothetical protein
MPTKNAVTIAMAQNPWVKIRFRIPVYINKIFRNYKSPARILLAEDLLIKIFKR